jgi:hypothetical protein
MEWNRPGTHGEGECSLITHIIPYGIYTFNPEHDKLVPVRTEYNNIQVHHMYSLLKSTIFWNMTSPSPMNVHRRFSEVSTAAIFSRKASQLNRKNKQNAERYVALRNVDELLSVYMLS